MAKKDTRTSIQDFIRHVDALQEAEDPEGNGFNAEYRLIHEVQVRNRREQKFQMEVGKTESNLRKNRYKDILPYDEHRVILSKIEGDEDSDYINASRLMGVKGTGGYIASQGPLAATVEDYWRMIWEYEVEIIFMACRIVELGKIKCKQYWNDVGQSEVFGDITVYTETEEEISSDFIQRRFLVTRGLEERRITQFHYSGWPDHGIPDDPGHIRDLIGIMRSARQDDTKPLLVHCSAGCGRTGAIVAIDFVWTLLKEGRFDENFSLYDLICNFREQRMSIVQTPEQYALVNKVLKALCEEWLQKMASHTYVNVDLNKECIKIGEESNGKVDPKQKEVINFVKGNPGRSNAIPAVKTTPAPSTEKPKPPPSPVKITGPPSTEKSRPLPSPIKTAGTSPTEKSRPLPSPVWTTTPMMSPAPSSPMKSAAPSSPMKSPAPLSPMKIPAPMSPMKSPAPLSPRSSSSKQPAIQPSENVYATVNKTPHTAVASSSHPPKTNTTRHPGGLEPAPSGADYAQISKSSSDGRRSGDTMSSASQPPKKETARHSGVSIPSEPVYSQVNKPDNRRSENSLSPVFDDSAYEDIQSFNPLPRRIHSEGNDQRANVQRSRPSGGSVGSNVNSRQLSGDPPGFGERLPRVKGPQATPTSWGNL